MSLGGGVFVTQTKSLPGTYINFVNTTTVQSSLGERGVVAIALPLGKSAGKVIEITQTEFLVNAKDKLGVEINDSKLAPLREIFRNAQKCLIYDLGEDGVVADALKALEAYEFNVLAAYTAEKADIKAYVDGVIAWRDETGKKCQVVVYNAELEEGHEGVINVISTVASGDAHALVAWVAGAEAGCAINKTCTNKAYNGEYEIVAEHSQTELAGFLTAGKFAFHRVYGEIRVLEDINSFVAVTAEKGEDFKYNQTIRVIDQIANDIARIFNTKYLGNIPNNASGRVSLWGDIVAHHRELETLQAIEQFDATKLTVEAGATKRSVVVNDAIVVTNAMTQLYMTVVVQ